jgi:hypothetical protein
MRRLGLPLVLALIVASAPSMIGRAAVVCDGTFHAAPAPSAVYFRSTEQRTPTDGWGVGRDDGNGGIGVSYRWDGSSWSSAALARPNHFEPYDVALVGEKIAWTVGLHQAGDGGSWIQRWSGMAWQIVSAPIPGGGTSVLTSVDGSGPSDVWAVGKYVGGGSQQILAMHWDGTEWTVYPVDEPPFNPEADLDIYGLSVVGASDAWLVGSDTTHSFVMHWNGSSWKETAIPASPGYELHVSEILAVSASNVWAIGSFNGRATTLHLKGGTWTEVPTPDPAGSEQLIDGGVVRASGIVVVGGVRPSLLENHRFALTWNGGEWKQMGGVFDTSRSGTLYAASALPTGEVLVTGSSVGFATPAAWYSCPAA